VAASASKKFASFVHPILNARGAVHETRGIERGRPSLRFRRAGGGTTRRETARGCIARGCIVWKRIVTGLWHASSLP
jgi:hypothetical protein